MNTETTFTLKAATHSAGSGTRFERQIKALCDASASVWHNTVGWVCISDETFTEFAVDMDVEIPPAGDESPFLTAALAVDKDGNRGIVVGARLDGLSYLHTHQLIDSNDSAIGGHYWWLPKNSEEDLVLGCTLDGRKGRVHINARQTYNLLVDKVQPVAYTEVSENAPGEDFSVLLGKFAEMKTQW